MKVFLVFNFCHKKVLYTCNEHRCQMYNVLDKLLNNIGDKTDLSRIRIKVVKMKHKLEGEECANL